MRRSISPGPSPSVRLPLRGEDPAFPAPSNAKCGKKPSSHAKPHHELGTTVVNPQLKLEEDVKMLLLLANRFDPGCTLSSLPIELVTLIIAFVFNAVKWETMKKRWQYTFAKHTTVKCAAVGRFNVAVGYRQGIAHPQVRIFDLLSGGDLLSVETNGSGSQELAAVGMSADDHAVAAVLLPKRGHSEVTINLWYWKEVAHRTLRCTFKLDGSSLYPEMKRHTRALGRVISVPSRARVRFLNGSNSEFIVLLNDESTIYKFDVSRKGDSKSLCLTRPAKSIPSLTSSYSTMPKPSCMIDVAGGKLILQHGSLNLSSIFKGHGDGKPEQASGEPHDAFSCLGEILYSSVDDRLLSVIIDDGMQCYARIMDVSSGTLLYRKELLFWDKGSAVNSSVAAVVSCGGYFIGVSGNGYLKAIDWRRDKVMKEIRCHKQPMVDVLFSAKNVITVSSRSIKLWRTARSDIFFG